MTVASSPPETADALARDSELLSDMLHDVLVEQCGGRFADTVRRMHEAAAALRDGDTVTIDTAAGSIVWDGGEASLPPQPPFLQELLAAGGIVEWARHRLEQRA